MNKGFYEEVHELVTDNKLKITALIAPPRTGSTLLQTIISRSPDINLGINDPQGNLYKQIIDETAPLRGSNHTTRIAIKLMSHWMDTEESYSSLFSLSDILVFSIRNPFLSTESRIKRFIDALTIKPQILVREWLINHLHVKDINPGRMEPSLYLNEQIRLLDIYAQRHSFSTWSELVAASYSVQNYEAFSEILHSDDSPTGFSTSQLGWNEIIKQSRFAKRIDKNFLVVDSTELRLNPESIIRTLTSRLGIIYNTRMTSWSQTDFENLVTETQSEDRAVQETWYSTLAASSGIKPPVETLPRLDAFPTDIREYLSDIGVPAYQELYSSSNRIYI